MRTAAAAASAAPEARCGARLERRALRRRTSLPRTRACRAHAVRRAIRACRGRAWSPPQKGPPGKAAPRQPSRGSRRARSSGWRGPPPPHRARPAPGPSLASARGTPRTAETRAATRARSTARSRRRWRGSAPPLAPPPPVRPPPPPSHRTPPAAPSFAAPLRRCWRMRRSRAAAGQARRGGAAWRAARRGARGCCRPGHSAAPAATSPFRASTRRTPQTALPRPSGR
mmetsp:Transcript_45393/g.147531  ORF Transcript_45393/g.147531 Transcript_45393/m.147531 type:complete len:228 (-) Transcript_45393:314-997(-)